MPQSEAGEDGYSPVKLREKDKPYAQSGENEIKDEPAEGGREEEKMPNINEKINNAMVPVVKSITKSFVGVPQHITSILGEIESISCGDANSFVIVKI